MSEEKNNSNFDINTKYEDMINISQRIIEHHEFVSDGSCEPPNYICLAYDVKNYLPDLLRENEELKKQLDRALCLLSEMYPPCEQDGFMDKYSDYCERNCGVDEEIFKKCWLMYIKDKVSEVE